MFSKGSKLHSIAHMTCPRCQEGKLFLTSNPYHKMGAMPDHCAHCGLRYQLEPSFFFGAMYVSYALTVATFVAIWIIMELIYDPEVWHIVLAIFGVLLALGPYMFRLSRVIWMNLFIHYAPEKRGAENL